MLYPVRDELLHYVCRGLLALERAVVEALAARLDVFHRRHSLSTRNSVRCRSRIWTIDGSNDEAHVAFQHTLHRLGPKQSQPFSKTNGTLRLARLMQSRSASSALTCDAPYRYFRVFSFLTHTHSSISRWSRESFHSLSDDIWGAISRACVSRRPRSHAHARVEELSRSSKVSTTLSRPLVPQNSNRKLSRIGLDAGVGTPSLGASGDCSSFFSSARPACERESSIRSTRGRRETREAFREGNKLSERRGAFD